MDDNEMISLLREGILELEEVVTDETVALSLSVRRAWYFKLSWSVEDAPMDLGVLHTLMDIRPELLLGLSEARNFRQLMKAAQDLYYWLHPRGYKLHIAGANLWTHLRLAFHYRFGGLGA